MGNDALNIEIKPGIFVPLAVANFLLRRLEWINQGGDGPFQVLVPKGFNFHDLCTLADLIANNQSQLATKMADNLSRSVTICHNLSAMNVSPSSGTGEKGGSGDDNFEGDVSNKDDSGSLGEPLMQPVVGPGVTLDRAVEKELQLLDLHAKSSEEMGEEEEMEQGGGDEDADLEEREEVTGEKEATILKVISYFTYMLLQFCICSALF